MIIDYIVYAAATTPPPETGNVVAQLFANVITTGVISALIVSGVQFFTNRKNARIQERKNAVDAESDLVGRYKEAAAEEREMKDSAVRTINDLLAASEKQVESQKATIQVLNETIINMASLSDSQKELITRLEVERDRTVSVLVETERIRDEKIAELRAAQLRILEMTMGPEDAARQVNDTFGI